MDNNELIFVFESQLTAKQLSDLQIKARQDNPCSFICESLLAHHQLQDAGFSSKYLYAIPNEDWAQITDYALNWLRTVPNTEPQIATCFLYKNTPLWYFIYDALFEVAGGIFDVILYAFLYQNILDQQTINNIIIIGTNQTIAQKNLLTILSQRDYEVVLWPSHPVICSQNPCEQVAERSYIRFSKKAIHSLKMYSNKVSVLIKKGSYWADNFIIKKALYRLSNLIHSRKNNEDAIALFCHHGNRSLVQKNKDQVPYITDHIYKNLEEELRLKHNNVKTLSLMEPQLSSNKILNKIKNWLYIVQGIYIPWYSTISYYSLIQLIRHKRSFKEGTARLLNNKAFQDCFVVGKHQVIHSCAPTIETLLPGLLTAASMYIDIAQTLVQKEKIHTIYTIESHSSIGRALALALHNKGGQLIGFQGGIITPFVVTNSGFYLNKIKQDIALKLLPDQFWIWGQFYKDLLEKKYHYTNGIQIKGNINLLNAQTHQAKTQQQDLKNILYIASSNITVFPVIMTVDEEIYTINKIAALLPEGYLLQIRLHPSHPIDLFKKRLSDRRNISIHSSASRVLAADLEQTNHVITKASSVLFDALAYNKLLILVNFGQTPDFIGIIKNTDWDLIASTENELKNILDNYLHPTEERLMSLAHQKEKLLRHFISLLPSRGEGVTK